MFQTSREEIEVVKSDFREMRHYIKQNQQFVTQSEMNLVNIRISEMSVRMANVFDRQKKQGVEVVLFTENGHDRLIMD